MTLVLDVRDLLRHAGSARAFEAEEPVEGLATDLARVPEDRPVRVELLVESVVEGILVSGHISGVMDLDCSRCLKAVTSEFRVAVQELFTAGAGAQDDEYPIEDDEVRLEPMIRDAVVLAMPFSPLCRPECLGLCERCGGDRNLGECTCEPDADERWAALSVLSSGRSEPGSGSTTPPASNRRPVR